MTTFFKARDAISASVRDTITSGAPVDSGVATLEKCFQSLGELPGSADRPYQAFVHVALTDALRDVVREANSAGVDVFQRGASTILSLTRALALADHVDKIVYFQLLEALVELQTTKQCAAVFDYLEDVIDGLVADGMLKEPMNRLVLTRTCNALLRRLSGSYDIVFCGRILMFVAYFCPLMDRSGLNITGNFNVSNVTTYEDTEPEGIFDHIQDEETRDRTEEDKSGNTVSAGTVRREKGAPPLDFNFYKTFWGLQDLLKNPVCIYDGSNWGPLVNSLEQVLAAFSGAAGMDDNKGKGKDKKGKTSSSSKDKDSGNGGSTSNSNSNVEDGDDADGTSKVGHFYYPKFLTSSKLMTLQVNDTSFRRHMLVQFLILFKYLRTNIPKSGSLSDEQMNVIDKLRQKAENTLERTRPRGPRFKWIIDRILGREDNWVSWKGKRCPSFEKKPAEDLDIEARAAKRQKTLASIESKSHRTRTPLGNTELARLWQVRTDVDALKESDSTPALISLDKYLQEFVEQLDPEAEIEEEYWLSNDPAWCWKAMRLMAKEQFSVMNEAAFSLQKAVIKMGYYTPPAPVASELPTAAAESGAPPKEEEEGDADGDTGSKMDTDAGDGDGDDDGDDVEEEGREREGEGNDDEVEGEAPDAADPELDEEEDGDEEPTEGMEEG